MACSSYRIVNNSEKYIYFDYRRCDNTLWEYQVPVPPGQSNNFWAINGTVKYPTIYNQFIELEDLGVAPPNPEYEPTPQPFTSSTKCQQFTVTNKSQTKFQWLEYIDCNGATKTQRFSPKQSIILCGYFANSTADKWDITVKYNPPNPCCPNCDPCYNWTNTSENKCYSILELNPSSTNDSYIVQHNTKSPQYSNNGTRFFGDFLIDGEGTVVELLDTPSLWGPNIIEVICETCINCNTTNFGDVLTITLPTGLTWQVDDTLRFTKAVGSLTYQFFATIVSYNSITGESVISCLQTNTNEDILICDFEVINVTLFWSLEGPLNRTTTNANYVVYDIEGNIVGNFPIEDWIGFSIPLNFLSNTETTTIYLGVGCDRHFIVKLDCEIIIDTSLASTSLGQNSYFYWNVYPINLTPGYHTLEVFGLCPEGALGFEVYNNTLPELTSATSLNDLNIIATSANVSKIDTSLTQTYENGPWGSTCPDGYCFDISKNKCVKILECTKPVTVNINLYFIFSLNFNCSLWGSDTINIQIGDFETAINKITAMCEDCDICESSVLTFDGIGRIAARFWESGGFMNFQDRTTSNCSITPGNYLMVPENINGASSLKQWWCSENIKKVVNINSSGVATRTYTIECGKNRPIKLSYNANNRKDACLSFDSSCTGCTYYLKYSDSAITENTVIYTDSDLTKLAPVGYYAGNLNPIVVDEVEGFRIASNGRATEIQSCISSFKLSYNSDNQEDACDFYDPQCEDCTYYTYYSPTGIVNESIIYIDPELTIFAPNGYYAYVNSIVVDELEGFRIISGGVVSDLNSCGISCDYAKSGNYNGSSYYSYPLVNLANDVTQYITFNWNAFSRPNRFSVYDSSGLQWTSGWKGTAGYPGPWGSSLNTPTIGSDNICFTSMEGRYVLVEAGPGGTTYTTDNYQWLITCLGLCPPVTQSPTPTQTSTPTQTPTPSSFNQQLTCPPYFLVGQNLYRYNFSLNSLTLVESFPTSNHITLSDAGKILSFTNNRIFLLDFELLTINVRNLTTDPWVIGSLIGNYSISGFAPFEIKMFTAIDDTNILIATNDSVYRYNILIQESQFLFLLPEKEISPGSNGSVIVTSIYYDNCQSKMIMTYFGPQLDESYVGIFNLSGLIVDKNITPEQYTSKGMGVFAYNGLPYLVIEDLTLPDLWYKNVYQLDLSNLDINFVVTTNASLDYNGEYVLQTAECRCNGFLFPGDLILNYDESDQEQACIGYDSSCSGCTYYISTGITAITEGTIIYTDSDLTTPAPNGYYAGKIGGNIVEDEVEGFRIISGGVVSDIVQCFTGTPTPTQTSTPTPTPTQTPTNTPTQTNTPTNTETPTNTPTETPTNTPTSTPGLSSTPVPTNTPTNTETSTNTPTPTTTNTETPTNTPTNTETPTNTPTNTPTLTPGSQCVQYNVSNTSEGPTTVTFVDCNYVTRNLVIQTGIFGQNIKICARAVLNQGATTWTETSEECPTLTVLLNYSLSGETDVCSEWSADTGNLMYYMSTGYTGLEDGAVIYTDSNLTNLAPDGFYSGYALNGEPQPNLQSFESIGGEISGLEVCSIVTETPTPTPTQTPTPTCARVIDTTIRLVSQIGINSLLCGSTGFTFDDESCSVNDGCSKLEQLFNCDGCNPSTNITLVTSAIGEYFSGETGLEIGKKVYLLSGVTNCNSFASGCYLVAPNLSVSLPSFRTWICDNSSLPFTLVSINENGIITDIKNDCILPI